MTIAQKRTKLDAFAEALRDQARKKTRDIVVHGVAGFVAVLLVSMAAYLGYMVHLTGGSFPGALGEPGFLMMAGLIALPAAAACLAALASLASFIRQRMKRRVMPLVQQMLGWEYSPEAQELAGLSNFQSYFLLPDKATESHYKSQLSGRLGDLTFVSTDAVLKAPAGRGRTRVVFRGTLLSLRFPLSFSSKTLLLNDRGIFNRERLQARRDSYESLEQAFFSAVDETSIRHAMSDPVGQDAPTFRRVNLGEAAFEKVFEAYSTDQVEARVLLTPDFMESILRLQQDMSGRNMRCAFAADTLFLVIEDPSIREPWRYIESMKADAFVDSLIAEIRAMLTISRLVKAQKSVFAKRASSSAVAARKTRSVVEG